VRRFIAAMVFLAALFGVWQLLAMFEVWPPLLLPSPVRVARWIGGAAADGTLAEAALVTLRRLAVGYLIGVAVGFPCGLLTARFRALADTLGVLALGFQALPSVCWVPLALLWFGQTETALLFVVVMGTVWSIMLAVEHGLRSVPPIYARAAKTMGSKGLHTPLHVTLPAALPFVVSGMKQGWAFAWRSLMAAEIYVTIITGYGLGHLLHYGRELHAMDQVMGVILVILAFGLAVDRLGFGLVERRIHRHWGTDAHVA
jgi:NitT/TauT family transport system permease protein